MKILLLGFGYLVIWLFDDLVCLYFNVRFLPATARLYRVVFTSIIGVR